MASQLLERAIAGTGKLRVKTEVALSYVPVILAQLDDDGREMLACLLQSMRDGGYDDGFKDGRESKKLSQ